MYKLDGHDADSGLNSDLVYSMSPSDGSLQLDPATGLITWADGAPPDRSHSLAVTVQDLDGEPTGLTATAKLSLEPADPSAFPAFTLPDDDIENGGRILIEENTIDSDQLPQLEANSLGLGAGEVVYEIAAGDWAESFRINPSSGKLSMVSTLDYEQVRKRQFRANLNYSYKKV